MEKTTAAKLLIENQKVWTSYDVDSLNELDDKEETVLETEFLKGVLEGLDRALDILKRVDEADAEDELKANKQFQAMIACSCDESDDVRS